MTTYSLSRLHGYPCDSARDWSCLDTSHPDYLAAASDVLITITGDEEDGAAATEALGGHSCDPIVVGDGLYAIAALIRDAGLSATLVRADGWIPMTLADLIDGSESEREYLVRAVRTVYGDATAEAQRLALEPPATVRPAQRGRQLPHHLHGSHRASGGVA